ncbi:Phospholipid methyltransferase [Penicillium angulare]|uniref:Phospholipid methyltransferase n=1 Tax=Penicillium angulare TaxID=116970 RepID=UPI00253FC4BF|nr:Phospholipid methyltransferase [Penicillium angulare]KAJ5263373.1 Phospholipid methyltransferase [Penicillium angulare]
MSQASDILLATTMAIAGILFDICATPPNPSPPRRDREIKDRIAILVGTSIPGAMMRHSATIPILYHALVTATPALAPEYMSRVCPRQENRNTILFEWNLLSATAFFLIFLGSAIRVTAYGGLGRSFTFHLAPPDDLVTSGIYSWIQHPSYTGLLLVLAGVHLLFLRWDGASACWIPESILIFFNGMGVYGTGVLAVAGAVVLNARVRDEEEMLRVKFGKKWEEWHARTRRIVPGVF